MIFKLETFMSCKKACFVKDIINEIILKKYIKNFHKYINHFKHNREKSIQTLTNLNVKYAH